jgi:hypothetical protein
MIKDMIKHNAHQLCQRTEAYAMGAFPLTRMQVQHALLDPATVETMQRLKDQGIRTIDQHSQTHVWFSRESLPGLTRSVSVKLLLPKGIFLREQTYGPNPVQPSMRDSRAAALMDLSLLDDETKERLADWANKAVRAHRLAQLAQATVNELIDSEAAKTTAHLRALWPLMASLVDDASWRAKFNVPTRALRNYQPSPSLLEAYKKRMAASEMVIMQGQILAPFQRNEHKVHTNMAWWEALKGDVRY